MIEPKDIEYIEIKNLTKQIRNQLGLKSSDVINIKKTIKILNGKVTYNKKFIDCIEKTDDDSFILHIANKTSDIINNIKKAELLGFLYIGMGYKTHKSMWNMVNKNVIFNPDIRQREFAECFALQLIMPDEDFKFVAKKFTKNNQIYTQNIAKHYKVPHYVVIDKLIMLGYR